MNDFKPFFEPESVVVIGASRNPEKLGYGVARNLVGSGYAGDIFFVNPRGGNLFDRPLYASLDDLPDEIDLALIVVPPRFVPETLEACGRKQIHNVIILTGGFKESGEEGAEIERVCQQIASKNNIRIIGPNCIGVLDTHTPLDTTFIQPPMPDAGEIAFITHSGALGAALIDWARGEGFGFSRMVSLGNQMDVTEADILLPVAESEFTKVVTLYLESVQNGRHFLQKAREVSSVKPLLSLKVGRTEVGQKAASSHTGALAGSDIAYNAAFRRAGVQRMENIQEMFQAAKALAWCALPPNTRVAILTNAGGPGVTAADAVERNGLQVASLSKRTKERLADLLPDAASFENPVDMLASASPQVYGACLRALLDDQEVDMVLVIAPPPPMFDALDIAEEVITAAATTEKPIITSFMGSRLVADAVMRLREAKIPEYSFPEDAVAAMAVLWKTFLLQQRDHGEITYHPLQGALKDAQAVMKNIHSQEGFIPPQTAYSLCKSYGIPVFELIYARSMDEAAVEATEIGYPLAMKIAIEGISHKSDAGGILLNLQNKGDVLEGFNTLHSKISHRLGKDAPFGVHLQKMARPGQEVIIGAVRDPLFGPMVMFGSGGVEVEGLKDIQFALAPLTAEDLDYLLENTWAGKKLRGFRSYARADVEAVKTAIIQLGQLMVDFPDIQEIEINPLIVYEEGEGAAAVDIRMLV